MFNETKQKIYITLFFEDTFLGQYKMSRSFRKKYFYKAIISKGKHLAKRRVRHFKGDLKNGNFYKKIFSSYDVIDNIYVELDTDKKIQRFKYCLNELKTNILDLHLTEEEVWQYIEELEDLKWYFHVKYK